ncbi:MAG: branched-chain amino acid ABC transporter permease [Actinobacteria bacterium]|nr:branched-chain amino acid ABC transporter permease [Actinomycetota bacterium]
MALDAGKVEPGPTAERPSALKPVRFARSAGVVALVAAAIAGIALAGAYLPLATALDVRNAIGLALFAVATNLLLGYGGLVSFGQAIFYGIGAYTVMLGWSHWGWSFWTGFVLAPIVAAVTALAVGVIALRARQLYFALLTLAFGQLAFTLAQQQHEFTGGDNGVFGDVLPSWLRDERQGFMFTLAVASISCFALWRVVNSPFGLTLRAIRENRERMEALGVNVFLHELLAFVISAFFCAIAGVLFVVHTQSAYPQLLDWTKSGEPILMAVIGGMFSFLGPVIGAFVYTLGQQELVQRTEYWRFVLGLLLLVSVLVRPDGLAGLFTAGWNKARRAFDRESAEGRTS